jgi:hypothetical protein
VGGVGTARMAWDLTQVVSLSADLNALTTESRQRGGGGEEGGWGLTGGGVLGLVEGVCVPGNIRACHPAFFSTVPIPARSPRNT